MTTSEIRENFWTFDFHKLNKIIEFEFWDFEKKFHFPKIWNPKIEFQMELIWFSKISKPC